jgi:hypothetical protein
VAKLAPVPDLEQELDRLYGLPLSEFTAGRNDLARRLRAAGQSEAAAEVAGLAKPSVSAWAVNQLARRRRHEVEDLARLGGELVEAQLAAASGDDGDRFEQARADHGRAASALASEAADLLAETGGRAPSDAVRRRVSDTLRALSLDPERHDELVQGHVAADAEPTGFALAARLGVPSAPGRRGRRVQPKRARAAELRAELGEARAAARDARRRASEADRDARRAEQEADRAAKRAATAASEADEAASRVETLEDELRQLTA